MGVRRRTGLEPQPWRTYALAGGGYVKVGRTTALPARVMTLQQHVPFDLELLGFVGADIEADALLALRKLGAHCRGEWFRDTPAVRRELYLLGFTDALRDHK